MNLLYKWAGKHQEEYRLMLNVIGNTGFNNTKHRPAAFEGCSAGTVCIRRGQYKYDKLQGTKQSQ